MNTAEARVQIRDAARRTLSREHLSAAHPGFKTISPEVGQVDEAAFNATLRSDADAAVALLADMAVATDRELRAHARQLAGRLLPPLGRVDVPRRRGTRRLTPHRGELEGDLDLERTLERGALSSRDPGDLVVRRFAAAPRAVCLVVDRSGSMSGHAVAMAAVAAAAIVRAASDRLRCGVIAFAGEVIVLRDPRASTPSTSVVDDLLSLRGHGRTDLAAALRAAAEQLEHVPAGGRTAILLSDCLHTKGDDPLMAAGALDSLHVLGTSSEPDAVRAGLALARRGNGHWWPANDLQDLARHLQEVLH